MSMDVNGQIFEKAIDSMLMEDLGDKVDFNSSIKYAVQDRSDITYATVDVVVGTGAEKMNWGTIQVNYIFTEHGIVKGRLLLRGLR